MSKKSYIQRVRGATMIEYVLIIGLIALVAIATMTTLGTSISGSFTKISGSLPS